MGSKQFNIWLADLTYTQQTIASDVIPAAVGGIAAYANKNLSSSVQTRIFKFPEDLSKAFKDSHPDIIGFSNYIWNATLSYNYAKMIKKHFPKTLVIFGGPNFPIIAHEQEAVLRAHPEMDFYVMKEAEVPFVKLIEELIKCNLNKTKIDPQNTPNNAFINSDGNFIISPNLDRTPQLEELPSPYVDGLMDPFLDGRLLPVIQTNRGCPFTCTFCTEGQDYWKRVRFKPDHLIQNELYYIAEHMDDLPANQKRTDLLIADSNFGMFPGDLKTCKIISETQTKYQYPKYINVATGKNSKERVLEAARLVNGAMKLAGSVQSLDPEVMKNIKRANISGDKIMEMAIKSSEIGTNTYSEVILALPGDSKQAHFKTLQTLVDSGFNTLSMYQLMMLPGTELSMDSTRTKYQMKTKYRVLPRCFGFYEFLNDEIVAAEIEEICVENNTLSYQDYLDCRRMNMIVNVFYNDGVFSEIIPLLQAVNISPWKWINKIYENSYNPQFDELVKNFVEDTKNELWNSREELENFINTPESMKRYRDGELGRNLAFKYKALSVTTHCEPMADVALKSVIDLISENSNEESIKEMAQEVIRFNYNRLVGIFDEKPEEKEGRFKYNIAAYSADVKKKPLEQYHFGLPQQFRFTHSKEQKDSLESYIRLFGNDSQGLSRILSRIFFKKFFRQAQPMNQPTSKAV